MNQLQQKQSELERLRQRLDELNAERDLVSCKIANTQKEVNTLELLGSISNINKDNTISKTAQYIQTTTLFFEQFVKSSNEFLLLKRHIYWAGHLFDLIIKKFDNTQPINIRDCEPSNKDTKLTISHLKFDKKTIYIHDTFDFADFEFEKERFILDEVNKIKQQGISPDKITQSIAFEVPCAFYAQLPEHRKGNFGDQYYGENLVYRGFRYGDALRFAIIGLASYQYAESQGWHQFLERNDIIGRYI